jgi:hypothetical protein
MSDSELTFQEDCSRADGQGRDVPMCYILELTKSNYPHSKGGGGVGLLVSRLPRSENVRDRPTHVAPPEGGATVSVVIIGIYYKERSIWTDVVFKVCACVGEVGVETSFVEILIGIESQLDRLYYNYTRSDP